MKFFFSFCSIGYVTLQDFMAFMISRETENVTSKDEILQAFKALSAEERPYLTNEEIYAVSGHCFAGFNPTCYGNEEKKVDFSCVL